jgi:hypothetical protein
MRTHACSAGFVLICVAERSACVAQHFAYMPAFWPIYVHSEVAGTRCVVCGVLVLSVDE